MSRVLLRPPVPRHPPRALSSFFHHSITVTTNSVLPVNKRKDGHSRIPQVTLYSILKVRDTPQRSLALTKNRPDAGRFAMMHQQAELGVAECHCQRSVSSTHTGVKRYYPHQMWVTFTLDPRRKMMVEPRGLEPLTPSLQRRCSPN